jgi:hypothetical protein
MYKLTPRLCSLSIRKATFSEIPSLTTRRLHLGEEQI